MNKMIEILNNYLSGKIINRTWRGHGTAVFIEVGELHDVIIKSKKLPIISKYGEASIDIEWEWRVEDNKSIKYGSADDFRLIDKKIDELCGSKISEISLYGRIQELVVKLDNGLIIRTCTMSKGQPSWTIFINDERSEIYGNYYCKNGRMIKEKKTTAQQGNERESVL
jgi:hypothetical protein